MGNIVLFTYKLNEAFGFHETTLLQLNYIINKLRNVLIEITSEDGITQVNHSFKSISKLDITVIGNISFYKESILYKNGRSVLTTYNVSSSENTLYKNIVAHNFCIDKR